VGTIFGVWPGEKLKDITGREQVRKLKTDKQTSLVCCRKVGVWCFLQAAVAPGEAAASVQGAVAGTGMMQHSNQSTPCGRVQMCSRCTWGAVLCHSTLPAVPVLLVQFTIQCALYCTTCPTMQTLTTLKRLPLALHSHSSVCRRHDHLPTIDTIC
jgi:hypothetical protein